MNDRGLAGSDMRQVLPFLPVRFVRHRQQVGRQLRGARPRVRSQVSDRRIPRLRRSQRTRHWRRRESRDRASPLHRQRAGRPRHDGRRSHGRDCCPTPVPALRRPRLARHRRDLRRRRRRDSEPVGSYASVLGGVSRSERLSVGRLRLPLHRQPSDVHRDRDCLRTQPQNHWRCVGRPRRSAGVESPLRRRTAV